MQRFVGLVERGEARRAIYDGNGIDVVELLFAVVDSQSELDTRTRGENVDGVGDGRARKELLLQLLGIFSGLR